MHTAYRRRKINKYEKNSDGTEAVISEGEFCKKGKIGINNWKRRGYKVLSTCKLIYFDTNNNQTKGVLDLTNVSFHYGPSENINKCLKSLNNDESAEEKGDTSFPLTLSLHQEESEQLQRRQKVELVFDNSDEAKRFCLGVTVIAENDNIQEFAKEQGWEDIDQEEDEVLDHEDDEEGGGSRHVSVQDVLSLQSVPLFSSTLYKQSKIRKQWSSRFLYVTEMGLLVYKTSENEKKIDGKMFLTDCDWFRTVVNVKSSDISLNKDDDKALKEDPSKLEKVTNIECLEIIDVVNNKDLVLAFNFLDMEDNMKQVTNFENFLLSQQRRISDLASIDSDKRESVKSSDGNVETETTSTRKDKLVVDCNKDDQEDDDDDDDEEMDSTTFSTESSAKFVKRNAFILLLALFFFSIILNNVLKNPGRMKILVLPLILFVLIFVTRIGPARRQKEREEKDD